MSSDTIISWNVRSNLSWFDFQGKTNPFDLGMAMTSYEIKILPEIVTVDEEDRIQGVERLTADARFYTNLSWSTSIRADILAHEQLHFDIAEVYARKI